MGAWQTLKNLAVNLVSSVAGRTGDVVLANTDISGLGTASTHAATDFLAALTGSSVSGSDLKLGGLLSLDSGTQYSTFIIGPAASPHGDFSWDATNHVFAIQTDGNAYPISIQGSVVNVVPIMTVGGTLTATGYVQSSEGTYHAGNSFAGTRLGATTDFAFSDTQGGWDIAGIFTAYTLGGSSQIAVLNKNITGGAGDVFRWIFSEYHANHTVMSLTWDGTYGNLAVTGTITGTLANSRTLFNHTAPASNTSTTETDLFADSVLGNTLTGADRIEVEAGGTFASSATATREVKLYFAGSVIYDSTALTTATSSQWTVYATIQYVSATSVNYIVQFSADGVTLSSPCAAGTLTGIDLTLANTLKITGQAAGTGAGSTQVAAVIEVVKYEK